jgi:transcriptional regulator of acetoin/glycerol metabolism
VRALLARSELGPRELGPGVEEELRRQAWPGNVRELGNVLLQAALRSDGGCIELPALHDVLRDRAGARGSVEPQQARRLLVETGGNVSAAARRARVPRSTFRDVLRAAEPVAG